MGAVLLGDLASLANGNFCGKSLENESVMHDAIVGCVNVIYLHFTYQQSCVWLRIFV